MTESLVDALTTLQPPERRLERLGIPPGPLRLRRAWPRSPRHLALEYTASDGCIIAGQWFAEADRLQHVARDTARSGSALPGAVVERPEAGVLLQACGADRRLHGLAPLLARPGATLLAHRPERRAVVRLEAPDGRRYAKAVRPERAPALIAAAQAVRDDLPGGSFTTPETLAVDVHSGVIVWSGLPGASLYDLLRRNSQSQPALIERWLISPARGVGAALRALHAAPPADAPVHDADAEVRVLQRWLEPLEQFAPHLGHSVRAAAADVLEALGADASPPVLLHRDFYDKQVFIDGHGHIGLLDFDTLSVGEAALDVANALVHLELRALQGLCLPELSSAAAAALLEGYRASASVRRRIGPYADASRLRLACVYAFRPRQMHVVRALLARVGEPAVGMA